jgi:hypothetical protein
MPFPVTDPYVEDPSVSNILESVMIVDEGDTSQLPIDLNFYFFLLWYV